MISSKECREIISVALEIIAFFFVTLDLYGEERLNRRTQSLSSAMDSISTKIRRRVWEPFKKRYEHLSRIMIGGDGEAPPEAVFVVIASVLAVAFAAAFAFLLGKSRIRVYSRREFSNIS